MAPGASSYTYHPQLQIPPLPLPGSPRSPGLQWHLLLLVTGSALVPRRPHAPLSPLPTLIKDWSPECYQESPDWLLCWVKALLPRVGCQGVELPGRGAWAPGRLTIPFLGKGLQGAAMCFSFDQLTSKNILDNAEHSLP